MFCPKCGYQQVSNDMRFCSRCGFSLAGVAELLIKNGLEPQAGGLLEKRAHRVSRVGASLLLFSIVSAPIFMILSALTDSPVPLFGSLFLFLAGLAFIAHHWIFSESVRPESRNPTELAPAARDQYLPPLREIRAADLFGRDTSDFTPPPSITDSTTKLLENESELPLQTKR